MNGVKVATIKLWGEEVGAVALDPQRGFADFEFTPAFLTLGLDIAPLKMPLASAQNGRMRYSFPELSRDTFMGLPGLLADSLPDRFGNTIIDNWLARQGRKPGDFTAPERLCYTGSRAVGALEFEPAVRSGFASSVTVQVDEMVDLIGRIMAQRSNLSANLDDEPTAALQDIIRVGTSAGGARPKAVIAYNHDTGEVRSGQVEPPAGFEQWLIKFDGVQDNTLGDPAGYGRIEYAYHLMARSVGIEMTACSLLEENGRAHFMTRRFDRPGNGEKLHLQSLCALAHFDFNQAGAYSYEQAFQVMRELRLPYSAIEQQFRRMVFNVVARNQDDHTKNIAFLMDRTGTWRLSPAFDVAWAYNPAGSWTNWHQMSIGGLRDGITRENLLAVGRELSIKRGGAIIEEIVEGVAAWSGFAREAEVPPKRIGQIASTHQLLTGPNP
ncbi:MAG: type II toxin-antitoxin system HipA family toxin [bacterium]|nr:type II toxin-antitoxin system HipA family toxin [bacterium]